MMMRMLIAAAIAVAIGITPGVITGVSAEDAACDGPNGGVDHAFDAATAPGRAGDHVPAGHVDFVVTTVTDSNPQVPDAGCP
jgi:hypothetical protein